MKNFTQHFVKVCPFGGSVTFIIEHFPSDKYIINQIILCITNCLLMIPTVLLNGISVLTILRNSQLKAKLCYFLILIQSTNDLGVGVISLPLYTFARASELLGSATCVSTFVLESIAFSVFGMSLITLCMLTFERYMSILHPVRHRSQLTKRRILVYHCCAVVLSIIYPLLILAFPTEKMLGVSATSTVLMILVLNTYAYTRIFLAVRQLRFSGDKVGDCSTEQNSSNLQRKRSLREEKLAKSCALVVLINYLCYIPSVVSYLLFKDDQVNFRISHSWSITVYALNSSLNSVIFFWKRPLLREEALKVLRNIL